MDYDLYVEFRIGRNRRPEGTSVTKGGVVHYTCNPPDGEIMEQYGIGAIGDQFGVGAREVLLIPERLFKERGINPGTVEAENLLRELGYL